MVLALDLPWVNGIGPAACAAWRKARVGAAGATGMGSLVPSQNRRQLDAAGRTCLMLAHQVNEQQIGLS